MMRFGVMVLGRSGPVNEKPTNSGRCSRTSCHGDFAVWAFDTEAASLCFDLCVAHDALKQS